MYNGYVIIYAFFHPSSFEDEVCVDEWNALNHCFVNN